MIRLRLGVGEEGEVAVADGPIGWENTVTLPYHELLELRVGISVIESHDSVLTLWMSSLHGRAAVARWRRGRCRRGRTSLPPCLPRPCTISHVYDLN